MIPTYIRITFQFDEICYSNKIIYNAHTEFTLLLIISGIKQNSYQICSF